MTDIPQAILIMKAYKEEQKKIQKFYEDFDDTIIRPRVLFGSDILKSIIVDGVSLRLLCKKRWIVADLVLEHYSYFGGASLLGNKGPFS